MNSNPFVLALSTGTAEETMKANNDIGGYLSNFLQLFFLIIVFLVIIFLAYYSTRFISSGKALRMKSQNLYIVDSISLGLQGAVHIVKAGDRFILIGVTKDKVTYLTEIDGVGIKEKLFDDKKFNTSFETILGSYMSNLFKKGDRTDQNHQSDDENKKVE